MILILFIYVCFSIHGISSMEVTTGSIEGEQVLVKRNGANLEVMPCRSYLKCNNNYSTSSLLKSDSYMNEIEELVVSETTWLLSAKFHMLEKATFIGAKLVGKWGDCSNLAYLYLEQCDYSRTATHWLSKCTKLRTLTVKGIQSSELYDVLQSATQITELYVLDLDDLNHIVQMPLFTNSSHRHLKKVDLDLPIIDEDRDDDIKWTEVSTALTWQLSLLPALEDLTLRSFDKLHFCASGSRHLNPVKFSTLKRVSLIWISERIGVRFLENCSMPKLEEILLTGFNSLDIEFSYLVKHMKSRPRETKTDLLIYWLDKNSCNIKFSRYDYLMLLNMHSGVGQGKIKIKYTYNFNHECTADSVWLVKALREQLILTDSDVIIECKNGTRVSDLYYERVECKRVVPCASPCLCCWEGPKDEFFADCRGAGLTALPDELLRQQTLTELLAPNNNISALPETLPDSLKLLDLSGNNIKYLNGLFAQKDRRWRLSGNPIWCNCSNYELLDMLQNRIQQIEDYNRIECVNKKYKFFNALPEACASQKLNISLENKNKEKENEAQLAREREKYLHIIVAAITVLLVAIVLFAVAFYYRKTIQIIMFSRGWCLCCIRMERTDEDRRFDIFLSFCHEDSEFVLGRLLPKLDQEYRVCMHLRDWTVGAMIPENIRNSVKESKKIMIILSKNFSKSLWGNMEFETAYAACLDERRSRILMVILDDVLESDDLHKDIKLYVRFNTYLRYDDPWFWSRLRHALPQTSLQETIQQQQPECVFPALGDVAVTENAIAEETSSNLESPVVIEVLAERSNSETECTAL